MCALNFAVKLYCHMVWIDPPPPERWVEIGKGYINALRGGNLLQGVNLRDTRWYTCHAGGRRQSRRRRRLDLLRCVWIIGATTGGCGWGRSGPGRTLQCKNNCATVNKRASDIYSSKRCKAVELFCWLDGLPPDSSLVRRTLSRVKRVCQ